MGTKEADASVDHLIALLERFEQHESPQSLEQFILSRRKDCRGHPPRLEFIQILDHFLHAANHERKAIVIEFVGSVVG